MNFIVQLQSMRTVTAKWSAKRFRIGDRVSVLGEAYGVVTKRSFSRNVIWVRVDGNNYSMEFDADSLTRLVTLDSP